MDKERNTVVALVGCGYWGPNLIRNFSSLDKAVVKWACDRSEDRLAHMQRLYPYLDTTTEIDQALSDPEVDAVAIATPVGLHYRLGMQCLDAGKHLFIEKPMAISSQECRELIERAEEKERTLMVGHTFIYTSAVRRIKEIVRSGDLGDVLYISSRRLNLGLFQKDINVAWDLAPHDISIILYLYDQIPETVNCQGKAHMAKGIEDVTNMTLNFDGGGYATIMSSWLDPNKIREMTIVGSKRMLVYNDIEPREKIKIYDARVERPPHYDTFAEFQYSYHYGDIYSPHLNQTEPLRAECDHFINCIRTGERPETSGYEGLQVVRILEAASESLRNEGAAVPYSEAITAVIRA